MRKRQVILAFLDWVTETAFWLLLLLFLFPVTAILWLAGKPLKASDLFRSHLADLLHWRRNRDPRRQREGNGSGKTPASERGTQAS